MGDLIGVFFSISSLVKTDDVIPCLCNSQIAYDNKKNLKGQCHQDFAVLGKFCAKIIVFEALIVNKCLCKAMTEISNEFYQEGLIIIHFLTIFGTRRIKT